MSLIVRQTNAALGSVGALMYESRPDLLQKFVEICAAQGYQAQAKEFKKTDPMLKTWYERLGSVLCTQTGKWSPFQLDVDSIVANNGGMLSSAVYYACLETVDPASLPGYSTGQTTATATSPAPTQTTQTQPTQTTTPTVQQPSATQPVQTSTPTAQTPAASSGASSNVPATTTPGGGIVITDTAGGGSSPTQSAIDAITQPISQQLAKLPWWALLLAGGAATYWATKRK